MTTTVRPAARSVWRTGLIAAAAAAGINLVLFLVASALGVELVVPDFSDPTRTATMAMPAGAVIIASLIGGVLGTGLRWVVARVDRLPDAAFPVLIVIGTLVSMAPIAQVGAGAAASSVMAVMHVVVGAAMLLAFRRR
jgi:hypothetical protein